MVDTTKRGPVSQSDAQNRQPGTLEKQLLAYAITRTKPVTQVEQLGQYRTMEYVDVQTILYYD